MNFDRFLPDYGILPSVYFERSAISNPIELFWSDDLQSLLRLCGEEEENIGERASDFDKFQALLRTLPLLEGHPTRDWICSVFKNQFNLQEIPTEENAANVWKVLCNCLFKNPIQPQSLVSGAWLCDSLQIPDALPKNTTPVLNANLFLDTKSKTLHCWSAEIASTVSQFVSRGCKKIVLHLSNNFDFVLPSVYHVNQALNFGKRSKETENLLICQLMRELCSSAQKQNLLLVLECEKNADAVANLLKYAEENVGLPRICWSVRKATDAYELLNFTAKEHKNEILAAFSYENVMTESELLDALTSWKMRYPIGRLCFVTARDLRQTPFSKMHIENILKNAKTKI